MLFVYKDRKAIFIADRGYESINSFEKIKLSGNKYLVRIKNIYSTGILRSFGPFSYDEFDVQVKRILTRKQTNEIKAHPEIYKFVPQNQHPIILVILHSMILNLDWFVLKLQRIHMNAS